MVRRVKYRIYLISAGMVFLVFHCPGPVRRIRIPIKNAAVSVGKNNPECSEARRAGEPIGLEKYARILSLRMSMILLSDRYTGDYWAEACTGPSGNPFDC
jgi:hypothetical protein